MIFRFAVPLLALGVFAQQALAQPGPRTDLIRRTNPVAAVPPIFRRAVDAIDRLSYAGTRTVEVMRGPDRVSHVEYVLHRGLDSRVWFPADSPSAGQVIVETDKERLHYYPRRATIEVLPPKREEAFFRLRQWVQNPGGAIRLTATNGGIVAGRPTELGIVSDAKGNVRQRLWIDTANGMILKREVLDAVGDRSGYFEFTKINYSPLVLPLDFQINVRGAKVVTLPDKLRDLSARNGLLNVMIPASTGFELQNVNMMQVVGLKVLHEAYSGKRGQLSLFQVAGNINLDSLKPQNQRGLQLFGWQMGGHSFALVGTYPVDELREISQILGRAGA